MKKYAILIFIVSMILLSSLSLNAQSVFKPQKKEGSLFEKVKNVSQNLLKKDSNLFRVPTPGQLKAWQFITESILNNRLGDAQQMISQLSYPYELTLFTDKDSRREYVLLEENYPLQAGWGFFVFDLKSKSNLVLEIPHPVYDGNTEFEGIDAFLQTGAKAYILAGAHRRANKQITPCTQPKSSNEDVTYPISDVAHSIETPFHAVHESIVKMLPNAVAVQLHGMGERDICPNAFMSTGSATVTTNSKRLAECLSKNGVETETYDANTTCPLNARSNVQGRFSNGETKNPCRKNVKTSPEPGNFIHIEQEPILRKNRKSWLPVIEALKCAFPEN